MNINSLKRCAVLGAILIGVGFSLPVAAQSHGGGGAHFGGSGHAGGPHGGGPRGGGGGWHGGGWRGGGPGWWGVGLGLGWDAWYFGNPYFGYPYPGYYYPYVPPTVVVAPTTQPEAPQNPPPVANWYYCESSKTYYPYVRQCAEAWQVVPATPPGSVR